MGSPQPIKLSEMDAYFNITGIFSVTQKARFVDVIQGMDGVYLDFAAQQAEKRRAQAASK